MKILADRIQNLTDARYFAAKEADFISFSIEEGSENYLDPTHVRAIKEWVEGPVALGEFAHFSADAVAETIDFLELGGAILGPRYSKNDLEKLAERRIFRLFEIEKGASENVFFDRLLDEKGLAEGFIFDFSTRGAAPFLPDFFQSAGQIAPVFLKMSFESASFLKFLESAAPAGIVFSGGDEERVGVKSFDEIDEFFDLLER